MCARKEEQFLTFFPARRRVESTKVRFFGRYLRFRSNSKKKIRHQNGIKFVRLVLCKISK